MRRMTGFMTVLALGLALSAARAKSRKPNATLRLSGGSVAAGVGVDWASGTLTYQGKHYPVNPLEVGFVPSTGRVFVFQLLDRGRRARAPGPSPPLADHFLIFMSQQPDGAPLRSSPSAGATGARS